MCSSKEYFIRLRAIALKSERTHNIQESGGQLQWIEATTQKWSFSYRNINIYTHVETFKMSIKIFLGAG